MLRDFAVEEFLLAQAAAAGLAVPPAELQQAANRFRLQEGLSSADETNAWLQRQRLSVDDFEAALERDLLLDKLKEHVTRDGIAERFAKRREAYAKASLRQIVVAREDLARELLSQIRDDGADFGELALRHALASSRSGGGRTAVRRRGQLSAEVAAAVFAAQSGQIVGPLATPQGFCLLLIEEFLPAELDAETTAIIRAELFAEWLQRQLQEQPISFPQLDNL
jgi:parvulin-like peptidyl-prolyl isomerase